MRTIMPSRLLTNALWIDAIGSGASALIQLAAPPAAVAWTGLPATLLVQSGWFMAGYALLLVLLARADRLPSALIATIALGNLGWALGCALLAGGVALHPGPAGITWLVLQAFAVTLFAVLQIAGLRASVSAIDGRPATA